MHSPALKASDIRVKFGSKVILDNVSIEIEAGKVTTLLGPNGAGKSTLLKRYAKRLKAKVTSITLVETDHYGHRVRWPSI